MSRALFVEYFLKTKKKIQFGRSTIRKVPWSNKIIEKIG